MERRWAASRAGLPIELACCTVSCALFELSSRFIASSLVSDIATALAFEEVQQPDLLHLFPRYDTPYSAILFAYREIPLRQRHILQTMSNRLRSTSPLALARHYLVHSLHDFQEGDDFVKDEAPASMSDFSVHGHAWYQSAFAGQSVAEGSTGRTRAAFA